MRFFNKPIKYTLVKPKKNVPDGLWSKCPKCSQFVFNKILEENQKVCPKCDYHFSLTAWERIELLCDKDGFKEFYPDIESVDPLNFAGPKKYKDKISQEQEKTSLKDAAIVGEGVMEKKRMALAVTDSRFFMGSMGSVVGEKITRIGEHALEQRIPFIIVSGSGGGARMHEGLLSLMQMAKTSGILAKLKENKVPFISVLTHPTMGGVMASFAGLGDIIIAEPHALIGFTGPRVIKQTIKQDLPKGFQTSEFSLAHGMLDLVVPRKELKARIVQILDYLA
jgi:acetyl-CoA carboxylase carboxyl transferase subunit beta